eukprot:880580-Prorocentrum_lima.AAC.1
MRCTSASATSLCPPAFAKDRAVSSAGVTHVTSASCSSRHGKTIMWPFSAQPISGVYPSSVFALMSAPCASRSSQTFVSPNRAQM